MTWDTEILDLLRTHGRMSTPDIADYLVARHPTYDYHVMRVKTHQVCSTMTKYGLVKGHSFHDHHTPTMWEAVQ